VIFLCDFVLTFGMACRQEGFVWTQMFTNNYEWFGVAAVVLMLLYNGQRDPPRASSHPAGCSPPNGRVVQ